LWINSGLFAPIDVTSAPQKSPSLYLLRHLGLPWFSHPNNLARLVRTLSTLWASAGILKKRRSPAT
jgi:hypothetical protein